MDKSKHNALRESEAGNRRRPVAFALIILGIVCVLYGVTIMLVGSGSTFFAFWYALGAVLVVLGLAIRSGLWNALPAFIRWAIAIIGGIFIAYLVVTQILIIREFNDRGEPDLDYVIVLGAQVRNTGPSVALASRLDAAYDYLMEYERTRCIVSGGQGPNEPIAEADAMYDYLVQRGIDPDRIIREDESLNTTQNIENSLGILNPDTDRIGIVSNDYHVFRALAIARKHGMKNICGIAAGATPWYLPSNMTREAFGLAKDFLAGNL